MSEHRQRALRSLSLLPAVALAMTFAFAATAGSAHAQTSAGGTTVAPLVRLEPDQTPAPKSVAVPIQRARLALKNTADRIAERRYDRAAKAVVAVRKYLRAADRAGTKQIGAPPTDPESDELPGPPSVIAVLGLEHRIVVRATKLLDGLMPKIGLGTMLSGATKRRLVMIDKIVSLDPEGAGGDYADGMTDTLPIYTAEIQTLNTALRDSRLTDTSRRALTKTLARAKQANAKLNAAYGGGE
jgi:hypothetical protein